MLDLTWAQRKALAQALHTDLDELNDSNIDEVVLALALHIDILQSAMELVVKRLDELGKH